MCGGEAPCVCLLSFEWPCTEKITIFWYFTDSTISVILLVLIWNKKYTLTLIFAYGRGMKGVKKCRGTFFFPENDGQTLKRGVILYRSISK